MAFAAAAQCHSILTLFTIFSSIFSSSMLYFFYIYSWNDGEGEMYAAAPYHLAHDHIKKLVASAKNFFLVFFIFHPLLPTLFKQKSTRRRYERRRDGGGFFSAHHDYIFAERVKFRTTRGRFYVSN